MIDNLDDYLIGVAFGIRFRPNFSIEDQLGRIIDTILYSNDSFFDPRVFPITQPTAKGKILFNEKTEDSLRVENSNIILELYFGEDKNFSQNDLKSIIDKFNKQIILGIMKEFNVKEINRIGYIKRYVFEIEELASLFVNKTIGNTLEGINDINLKFSKNIPMVGALAKKDVNDFDNAIFTVIKRAELKEIFMSVDYQSYFDPLLPSSQNIRFQEFLSRANGFNSKNFNNWLNEYYMESLDG